MKICIVNPPHTAIGSRVPDDHLPPLGLLSLGGPLIDAGHDVSLIDAEFGPVSITAIVWQIVLGAPWSASNALPGRKWIRTLLSLKANTLWQALIAITVCVEDGSEKRLYDLNQSPKGCLC
ncbi:hypothetical protein ASD74_11445 [Rhizobium sp. Root564]|nr:hypothetical protein ASD74_11445 [Rhizobium sp. Root564]